MDSYTDFVVMGTQTPQQQAIAEEISAGVFEFHIGEKERAKYRIADEEERARKNVDFSELHKLGEAELAILPLSVLKDYMARIKKNHRAQKGRNSPDALKWAMRIGIVDRAITKSQESYFKKISEEGGV